MPFLDLLASESQHARRIENPKSLEEIPTVTREQIRLTAMTTAAG